MNKLKRKAKAAGGYGIVLLIVFLASTILIGTSMQLTGGPNADRMEGQTAREAASAQQLASTGMLAVRSDILADLDAGTTVDTSYRYPGASPAVTSVTAYRDPANYAAGSDVVGSYYGTVTYASGDTYVVKVTATAGGSTFSKSDLFHLGATSAPFSCSLVESTIALGHISSLSSAFLQSYATTNCMLITATAPAAPPAGTGATACSTSHSGSGTLDLTTCSANETATGTYTTIQMKTSGGSVSGSRVITSTSAGARTINVPGTVGVGTDFTLTGAGDQSLLLGDSTTFGDGSNITASTGNDIIRIGGAVGTLSTGTFNIDGGAGNNSLYAKSFVMDTSGATATLNFTTASSAGSNNLYFDAVNINSVGGFFSTAASNLNILGGTGDDIISCNGAFGGACTISATGAAGFFGNGVSTLVVDGRTGNNKISLNGTISGQNTYGEIDVYGGSNTGYNIIYVKACGANNTISPGAASGGNGSGKNLIIVGTSTSCSFQGITGSDVVLYHAGSAPGAAFSRKLTY
jgi:hypothetical protein